MAKRTVTSKGMRVKLRSANRQIESLTGTIHGLKQQVLLKEQTITILRDEVDAITEQTNQVCSDEAAVEPVINGEDS